MMPSQGFRTFFARVLHAASRARPVGELVEDLCHAVSGVLPSDCIEIWLVERTRSARWSMAVESGAFRRHDGVERRVFDELRRACGASEATLRSCTDPPVLVRQLVGADEGERFASILAWPLAVGSDPVGYLVLTATSVDAFEQVDETFLHDMSQTLTAALTHNRIHLAQRERVKELSCLYELAQLATLDELDLDSLLRRVVALLPPSWRYPESAAARLEIDGRIYETQPHQPTWPAQRAEISIAGSRRGFVEVAYTEPMPALDEGPFLFEERRLIDAVAAETAALIERNAVQHERLQPQDQLRHADRLATIGHLAAGVAHELNEPLGAILGFAQLARKHPDIAKGVDRDVEKIEAAALHAREVTARLMHVGRRNTPHREGLDLNVVVRDGLAFLGARVAKHRIDLSCALEPGLPVVMGNRAQLQQIVINLVVNAIQAMPKGGALGVSTALEGDGLALVVRDSGVGMSPAVQARIFEPFFTTKEAADGTGLGLPVVRGIVESLRGSIDVESQPDAGSVFSVWLPVDPDQRSDARGG